MEEQGSGTGYQWVQVRNPASIREMAMSALGARQDGCGVGVVGGGRSGCGRRAWARGPGPGPGAQSEKTGTRLPKGKRRAGTRGFKSSDPVALELPSSQDPQAEFGFSAFRAPQSRLAFRSFKAYTRLADLAACGLRLRLLELAELLLRGSTLHLRPGGQSAAKELMSPRFSSATSDFWELSLVWASAHEFMTCLASPGSAAMREGSRGLHMPRAAPISSPEAATGLPQTGCAA